MAQSHAQSVPIDSMPSSPHLPSSSCPTSPSGSISSLPSVGSSYFFSSAAASPPHPPHEPHLHEHSRASHHPQVRDSEQGGVHGLIIPELTLPTALRKPTAYGQTLGDLRLIVIGDGATEVARSLLDDNEDVVELGTWEAWDGQGPGGEVLRASSDWIEHRDAHGLEKFEAARNVEIVAFESVSLETLESTILSPFHPLLLALNPAEAASGVMSNLLASPYAPLYTVLIHVPSAQQHCAAALTTAESQLLSTLAPLVPIITLPLSPASPPSDSVDSQRPELSAFAPRSLLALRASLFRNPETLALLRGEAADRFLRWREAQRLLPPLSPSLSPKKAKGKETIARAWSKKQWECEWEHLLSADVARARARTVTQDSLTRAQQRRKSAEAPPPPCYDPLHLPSFLSLTLALLRPAKAWAGVILLGMGGFCVGMGLGVWVGSRGGSAWGVAF
ncbi:hypothetical protein HWV62_41426 [Athelia sp. TMB]|nr:hypothetical protein HWV62_41426 [Athelia sp. TMB]